MRNKNALWVSGMLLCAVGLRGYAVEVKQSRPNIVLIFADDMGYTMSAVGTPGIRTPNLDRMKGEGIFFTHAYSAQAVCSPSRGAILTGTLPDSNGIDILTTNPDVCGFPAIAAKPSHPPTLPYRSQLHENIVTLPEVLKEHEYFSAITQKLHVEPAWKFPFSKGFNYHNRPQDYRRLIDEVVRDSRGKPFFIMANISTPHRPYDVHLKANDLLNPDGTAKGIDPSAIEVPPYLADTPEMRRDLAKYYACVQLTDACAGAVLAGLRSHGLLDSTLVIFSSDNGFPYHRAKVSDYPAGLHEPFIVLGKNIAAGQVSDTPISLIDVMPTFLEYLGIKSPETVQGRSLWPLLSGESTTIPGRETVYGMCNEHYLGRMVSDGQFYYAKRYHRRAGTWSRPPLNADLYQEKPWGCHSFDATIAARGSHPEAYAFLRKIVEGDQVEEVLYDLKNDPWGMHNLIDDPEYAPVVKRLQASMGKWRQTANDPEYVKKRLLGDWVPARFAPEEKPPSLSGWMAGGTCMGTETEGMLRIDSTGNDPHISLAGNAIKTVSGPFTLSFRMKSEADGMGRIYYGIPSENRTVLFPVQPDGQWHVYSATIPVDVLTGLRLDPATAPGTIDLDWLRLKEASGKTVQQWSF